MSPDLSIWFREIRGGAGIRLRDLVAAKATLSLVVLIGAVHAVLWLQGGVAEVPGVYRSLGLSRAGMAGGNWWQPLSYPLLHGNGLHLFVNALALLMLGPRLERIGGARLMLLVFVGGCLLGGASHLVAAPGRTGLVPLVGASGGIVALLLWLTGVSPESRMWPLPVSGRSLGLGLLISSGLLALMDPQLEIPVLARWGGEADRFFQGYLFQASHACHFGGALAGWAWSRWALRPRVTLETLRRQRALREAEAGEERGGGPR